MLIANQHTVIVVTILILSGLFLIQRFGTAKIGQAFGPIMFVWFTALGWFGLYRLAGNWSFLRALNPAYAVRILCAPQNRNGLFILGSIFWPRLALKPCIRIWDTSAVIISMAAGRM